MYRVRKQRSRTHHSRNSPPEFDTKAKNDTRGTDSGRSGGGVRRLRARYVVRRCFTLHVLLPSCGLVLYALGELAGGEVLEMDGMLNSK